MKSKQQCSILPDQNKINIEDYSIIKKLSGTNNTQGDVLLVKNKINGELVAAKVIKKQYDENLYEEMVNNELSILINCQYPTIIPFYGFSPKNFDGDNECTIFIKYAVNGSLSKYLKENRTNFNDATLRQKALIGISHGLMMMHKKKYIHFDVKPDNTLFDENFNILIIDFGVSKCNRGNKCEMNGGSPIYMAPESFLKGKYDQKSDVYSFGILLYEVVTRTFPYEGIAIINRISFLKDVSENGLRPKFKGKIKRGLKKLIEECLQSDPDNRPDMEEVYKKLSMNIEGPIRSMYHAEDDNDENEDEYKYYLDGVDVDAIHEYVDYINKNSNEKTISSVNPSTKESNETKTFSSNSTQIQNIENVKDLLLFYKNQIKTLREEMA